MFGSFNISKLHTPKNFKNIVNTIYIYTTKTIKIKKEGATFYQMPDIIILPQTNTVLSKFYIFYSFFPLLLKNIKKFFEKFIDPV